MAEHDRGLDGDPRSSLHPDEDRDIPVARVLGFALGVAIILLVSVGVCAIMYHVARATFAQEDPPPSPVKEANAEVLPPPPRLQVNPVMDMDTLRVRERAILDSYGWADKDAGVARIPVDRAIDLMVEAGIKPALTEGAVDGGAPEGGAP